MSGYLNIYRFVLAVTALWCISGCSIKDVPVGESHGDRINVDGLDTGGLVIETRANEGIDAEDVSWLRPSLISGINVRYGLYGVQETQESVAVLKFVQGDYDTEKKLPKPAAYSFKYLNSDNDALWKNNGLHYFRGVYVPDRIRYTGEDPSVVDNTAPGLVSDQHDDAAVDVETESSKNGNYTLLSRYLSMPADFRLAATVERIKLPFKHRLARVVAFVLIDPELNTTLKGYTRTSSTVKDDPTTTSIRFCNVKVLQGVHDYTTEGNHYLTPSWTTARSIIPHFDGERGSYSYKDGVEKNTTGDKAGHFLYYYKQDDAKRLESYPSSADWQTIHDASKHNGYTEVDYGKVPVYDVIVRPTYSDVNHVMHEEAGYPGSASTLAAEKNQIDFELELANGLRYQKRFEFDLDANYQTVVYLRISREHVDYNDAGSDVWVEEKDVRDGWYGVDNRNGNTLSFAGSSWQRAYTYGVNVGETNGGIDGVTDGSFYNASTVPSEKEHAQYFTSDYQAMWVERFLQAYEGGAHHGDYFALKANISIDARLIPQNFVFTGHLDGQDYTITLTNSGKPVYKDAESLVGLFTESGGVYTSWNIPTLYVKVPVYYIEDELAEVEGISYVKSTLKLVAERTIYYTQKEADEENSKPEHHPLIDDSEGRHPTDPGYVETRDMENYVDGYEPKTTSSVKETIPAHYETTEHSVRATVHDIKEYQYHVATAETDPTYPTTLEQLKTAEYYVNDSGTRFTCPELYQFSHNSSAYLFDGLNGTYTTPQESDPSLSADLWQANVHREKNNFGSTDEQKWRWVPTAGYRAEVLNVKVASSATLFKDGAEITGNVQNCWNGTSAITNNTPDIPQYK